MCPCVVEWRDVAWAGPVSERQRFPVVVCSAVFMPLCDASVVRAVPLLEDLQLVVIINAGLIYFGGYLVFAMFCRLSHISGMRSSRAWFVAGERSGCVSRAGRGVLGYMLPQDGCRQVFRCWSRIGCSREVCSSRRRAR